MAASAIIYSLGKSKAPKSQQNGEKISTYACGERARFGSLAIDITLCKYLVYFMILDSAVLILAFASLGINQMNFTSFVIYLFMILVATFLLSYGGE